MKSLDHLINRQLSEFVILQIGELYTENKLSEISLFFVGCRPAI